MEIGIAMIGLICGLGVNYLSDVLPIHRKLVSQPICTHCGMTISWKDYILFKPCKNCHQDRWVRNKIIAILMPVVFLAVWYFPNGRLSYIENVLLITYFFLIGIIDLEHRLILHPTSILGAAIGLFLGVRMHGLMATLIGGAAGFTIMFVLYYLGGVFTKLLGKWRGEEIEEIPLGFGDVNLSGVLGLILGWPGVTAGLLFAILAGGIFSGFYIVVQKLLGRYQAFSAIPYAPFLLIGCSILLFVPK